MAKKFDTVEDYVAAQPAPARDVLNEVRRRVETAVPRVAEAISYDIPTFTLDGKAFIHVAAWKQHIAVYPVPAGDEAM